MQTAFQQALETNLWLRLIFDAKLSDASELKSLLQESTEIKKILALIVKNSKK